MPRWNDLPIRAAFCTAVLFFATIQLFAQTTGTILGRVTDASGAVIVGATVKAENVETNLIRTAITNPEGDYLIPSLPPGTYQLVIEQAGFKRFTQSGITLQVGENARVDGALQVGALTDSVNVQAEVLRVDTQSTTVGTTVDNRRLTTIPLNGRNVLSLTQLLPGVGIARNISAAQPNGRDGATVTVSGNRDTENNYLMDGTSMLTNMYNRGTNLANPDALQEFRVLTNTMSAEYGRAAGGVFLAVSKSGTNELHGSLFEFLRNDNLNASNFFSPGRKPKLAQNQFGGSIGGPVILPGYNGRNRTFIFGSYQGLRIREETLMTIFPPSAAEARGDFSGSRTITDPQTGLPFPDNKIPASRLNTFTSNFIKEFLPAPNQPDGRSLTLFPQPTDGAQILIKGDHHFSSADRLSMRYFRNRDKAENRLSSVIRLAGPQVTTVSSGVINETHVFSPGLLAEFHISFLRTDPVWISAPFNKSPRELGANYNIDGPDPLAPQMTVSGRFTVGPARHFEEPDDTTDVAGKASWIKGRHVIKFGGEIRHLRHLTRAQQVGGFMTFDGTYTGNAMADFVLGRNISYGTQSFLEDESRTGQYQFFGQDDIKVSRRVTLNLGLRYELNQPWVQVRDHTALVRFGQQSTLFPAAPLGLVYPRDNGVPRGLYPTDKNNFAPRVGLAWDLFGNGRTSLRAAYGVFYVNNGAIVASVANQNAVPYVQSVNVFSPPSADNPYGGGRDPLPFTLDPKNPVFTYPLGAQWIIPSSFRDGYTQQYNLNIQHQFGSDLFVQVGYVGNVGRKMAIFSEANGAVWRPGATAANIQARRPYLPQYFTTITPLTSDANSSYNSLQMSVDKRFSHGYTLQLAYTFSRTLDQRSAGLGGGPNAAVTIQDPNNLRAEWGLSGFSQKHVLAVNGIWDIPFLKNRGAVSTVFGGWQLAGTTRVASGLPFTVVSGRDNRLLGGGRVADRPDVVGSGVLDPNRPRGEQVARYFNTTAFIPNAGPGKEGQPGNSGRNSLVGPGFSQTDLALLKRFNLKSERRRLEFRTEFFNALNQVNFNNPDNTLVSPAFGRLLSALDGRIVQFGLRLDF